VASYVQKTAQKDLDKMLEMAKNKDKGIKRSIGFCLDLTSNMNDLEDTWSFLKIEEEDGVEQEEEEEA
jgi:hypothetical protein